MLAFTMATSVLGLAVNLATGVITARSLEPGGRGLLAAAVTWVSLLGLASTLGMRTATTVLIARDGAAARMRSVASSALVIGSLCSIGMITFAAVVIPSVYGPQGAQAVNVVRLFVCSAVLVVWAECLQGVLAGLQLLNAVALLRLAQPACYLACLVALVAEDWVSLSAVLVVQVMSWIVPVLWAAVLVGRRLGFGPPKRESAQPLWRYGRRVYVGSLATMSNSRLDMFLLPHFAVAAQIGFYSVAANMANVLQATLGSLGAALLPLAAARSEEGQRSLLGRTLRVSTLAGVTAWAVLGFAAPTVISLLYGRQYLPAVLLLRVLLPGVIFWSLAGILSSGLQAHGLPGRASLAQGLGFIVTALGLWWALPVAGVRGAAWVSLAAYCFTFLLMVAITPSSLLNRRDLINPMAAVSDIRSLVRKRANALAP